MAAAEGHSLYIEKLRSLKTLGQLQRGLGRLESQVERCCGDSEVCWVLVGECEGEVKRLGEERTRLLNRVKEIDMDMQRLTELSEALRWDAQVKLAASSVGQYTRTLSEVNGVRVTLGLPPLLECDVSVQARERGVGDEKPPKQRCVAGGARAGRSHKPCPHCLRQVSRNAVVCRHCSEHCSQPRRQKKKKRNSTNCSSD